MDKDLCRMAIREPKHLLAVLREQRAVLNINAQVLAASANVSTQFLSMMENGKESVQVDEVIKVAHALGVEIPVLKTPEVTGQLVRHARDELGVDQIVGAALCNVSPRYLSTVENGKPNKRLNKLFDVLNGFGIGVEVML